MIYWRTDAHTTSPFTSFASLLYKNISDTLGYASCATFLFLPHFDVICDLLLNRGTASWNLFVNKICACHNRKKHVINNAQNVCVLQSFGKQRSSVVVTESVWLDFS